MIVKKGAGAPLRTFYGLSPFRLFFSLKRHLESVRNTTRESAHNIQHDTTQHNTRKRTHNIQCKLAPSELPLSPLRLFPWLSSFGLFTALRIFVYVPSYKTGSRKSLHIDGTATNAEGTTTACNSSNGQMLPTRTVCHGTTAKQMRTGFGVCASCAPACVQACPPAASASVLPKLLFDSSFLFGSSSLSKLYLEDMRASK